MSAQGGSSFTSQASVNQTNPNSFAQESNGQTTTPFQMPQPPTPATHQSVQYQELLSTISELQLDLQRTVGLAQKLKAENAGVRVSQVLADSPLTTLTGDPACIAALICHAYLCPRSSLSP